MNYLRALTGVVIDPGHGEYPYARYNKFKLKNSKVF